MNDAEKDRVRQFACYIALRMDGDAGMREEDWLAFAEDFIDGFEGIEDLIRDSIKPTSGNKRKLTPCSYHKGFIEDCGCAPGRIR